MALAGSIQSKRPGAGVYPGAGVAQGGQQGRMSMIHNGVASRSGGSTPGASQRGMQKPKWGSGRPAIPVTHNNKGRAVKTPSDPYRYVMRNGNRVAVRLSRLTPAERASFDNRPPAPVGGGGAAETPGYTPSFALEDSDYFMQLADAQLGFDNQLNPVNAELARLRYQGVGGKTLYDTMFENANRDFGYAVRDTRDGMSKRGLGRSGRMDRAASDLSTGWLDQQRQLDESVGGTAINRLETQAAQARSVFAQQQAALQMAAKARADARREAYNASLFGQAIMPEEG